MERMIGVVKSERIARASALRVTDPRSVTDVAYMRA
jgi:hypothetical protein